MFALSKDYGEPDMVVPAYNPSTREVEAESGIWSQPKLCEALSQKQDSNKRKTRSPYIFAIKNSLKYNFSFKNMITFYFITENP